MVVYVKIYKAQVGINKYFAKCYKRFDFIRRRETGKYFLPEAFHKGIMQ